MAFKAKCVVQVQMTHFEQRPFRTVLIPWIVAVLALVGWNALIPDHARARKLGSSGELELSQLADDTQPLGRVASPQVFLADHPTGPKELAPSSCLVLVEERKIHAVLQSRDGKIRGRAPPVGLVA
jgi:hypothetical protein